ncbi:topoisomerase IV [Aestuariibacter halophilus]|uniref:Topoisomerase IV n=1 Tax=Fluctibacter halophilus TaxID=226011 RepID=A0ABS8G730_9ALTE|nr:topoisomerase IV [Aestuariibacter halophilus]MCC2616402.1 topoisomerase IV [Aestuariibacter halophilus]
MKKTLLATTILSLLSTSAMAEVRINGFANLIAGKTSSEDTLYGYDDDIGFDQESLFAIQVSGDINSKMTATGQVMARGSDDYDAEFEWAYLTYQATDNTSISAGRLRMPLFRYSASSDVGYSYHWVTAPRAVYAVDFNNIDGVRVDYSDYAGSWEYNLQAALGTVNSDVGGAELDGDNTILVSAEATYDWFKIRGVYARSKATLDLSTADSVNLQAANAALAALPGLGLGALEDAMQMRDDTGEFFGLGIEVDTFEWFISAEITSIEIEDSFNPKDTSYYVTAGMRFGAFTPSLTYENKDGTEGLKFQSLLSDVPAQLQPTAAGIVNGIQMAQQEEYDVLTLGIRYDYDTNIALKADLSRYSDDVYANADSTLMRVGVNYVF